MRVKVHVIASYVIASTASEYPLPNVKYDLKMSVIVICHRSDFHAIHGALKVTHSRDAALLVGL